MMSHYHHSRSKEDKPTHIAWPHMIRSGTSDMNVKTGTAIILTAEGIGYQTVCTYLHNVREEVYRGSVYERGTFVTSIQTWEVGLVEMGQGGTAVSLETERALSYFQPDVLLYISLATGMQDVQLGDVVSAMKVYAYESDKSEAPFETRPVVWNVSYDMEQRARTEARQGSWLKRVKERSGDNSPKVVLGPIAAGEKVIASTQSSLYPFLLAHYNDAVAIETGSHGVLVAAHAHPSINFLMVCGIAELIQNDQAHEEVQSTTDWRRVAAQHASAFAFEVLVNLIPSVKPPQPAVEKIQEPVRVAVPRLVSAKETGLEIFYSYAPEDKQLAKQLQKHLAVMEQHGLITNWDEDKIRGGSSLAERQRHLNTAPIIVILVSPDYIASHYYEDEAKLVMIGQINSNAIVIPVLLRPMDGWQYTHFKNVQPLPKDKKAITVANRDQVLSNIASEIRTIVENYNPAGPDAVNTQQKQEEKQEPKQEQQTPSSPSGGKFNMHVQGNIGNVIQGDRTNITINNKTD